MGGAPCNDFGIVDNREYLELKRIDSRQKSKRLERLTERTLDKLFEECGNNYWHIMAKLTGKQYEFCTYHGELPNGSSRGSISVDDPLPDVTFILVLPPGFIVDSSFGGNRMGYNSGSN